MKRRKYQKVMDRDCIIVERITAIKAEHPFWGYRRVWAHLKYIDHMPFNQKRIYRIMRDHNLLVKKNMKLKAIRRANTKKPKPTRPNQWWGIDMTKVMLEGFGWIYITICIDWYTKKIVAKKIVGYEAGLQSKAWHCLKVLNKGVNQQFPDGIRGHELHLMSDNGCQPTSISFMKECSAMDIQQAFTSYNNPKGNADTERFMRTMKEEFAWINEWASPTEFCNDLDQWISYYNNQYLHSSLGYKPPAQFEEEYHNNQPQNTLLENAC